MKIIKPLLLIIPFFLSISIYGQTDDSLKYLENKRPDLLVSNFSSNDEQFGLRVWNVGKKEQPLLLYNRNTNSYDIYLNYNGNYSYSGSSTIFKNKSNFFTTLFLGNDSFLESNTLLMNNRSLLLDEDVSYMVRDSFNPNGASNFSEAILGGVLGLLFNR